MAIPMFSLGCGGIKEKDFAKQQAELICDLIFECNCYFDVVPSNKGECIETWLDYGQITKELADLEQLKYDDECAEEELNDRSSESCGPRDWDDPDSCSKPCKRYYGPVPSGGTCTVGISGYDNCKQGSVCGSSGICINPCEEPHLPSAGESCYVDLCDEDSYCFDDGGSALPMCVAWPTVGQPCTDSGQCHASAWCDSASDTCQAHPTLGLPCDQAGQECQGCTICDSVADPVCVTAPGRGAECNAGRCDAGLVCNSQNACESAICNEWDAQDLSGTGGVTTGTDPTTTGTDPTTTGGGATCDDYGQTIAACLGDDAAAATDECNTAITGGTGISAECGAVMTGYYQCMADATCDEHTMGTAATDCFLAWDFSAVCV